MTLDPAFVFEAIDEMREMGVEIDGLCTVDGCEVCE